MTFPCLMSFENDQASWSSSSLVYLLFEFNLCWIHLHSDTSSGILPSLHKSKLFTKESPTFPVGTINRFLFHLTTSAYAHWMCKQMLSDSALAPIADRLLRQFLRQHGFQKGHSRCGILIALVDLAPSGSGRVVRSVLRQDVVRRVNREIHNSTIYCPSLHFQC